MREKVTAAFAAQGLDEAKARLFLDTHKGEEEATAQTLVEWLLEHADALRTLPEEPPAVVEVPLVPLKDPVEFRSLLLSDDAADRERVALLAEKGLLQLPVDLPNPWREQMAEAKKYAEAQGLRLQ